MNYECLLCQVKSLEKRIEKFEVPIDKRNIAVKELLKKIGDIDLNNSYMPEVTRNLMESLKKYSKVSDPYKEEKEGINAELLNKYNDYKKQVNNSDNPFDYALRLAIAGNIIDFGPNHIFDLNATINKVLTSDFAINQSIQLKEEIKKAKTILYLGDNSGEIVFDKLFIETLGHPNIYYGVRGMPVLNDNTEKEAHEVGIDKFAKVINNGDDAPSTLLHRVSPDFMKIYKSADLIISKGMGNYEGLMNVNDPRIFFLLMVKCKIIGEKIGAKKGDFVVKKCC